jgi:E3 ubiquitin-protein ligase DOA10
LAEDCIAVCEVSVTIIQHLDKKQFDEEDDPHQDKYDLKYFFSPFVHRLLSKEKYCKKRITNIVNIRLVTTFIIVNQKIPNPPA